MSFTSETERSFQHQTTDVLEALPVLRRWLTRSLPPQTQQEGATPLPLSHIRALIHLYQHGPLTMGDLARGLGISCSAATECVASLEIRDRVARERPLSDRRQVVVSLTPEAEAIAEQVLSQRKVVVEKALSQLSPYESLAFVQGLRLLAQSAELWMRQASDRRSVSPQKESTNV